jgi:hypothetical protein
MRSNRIDMAALADLWDDGASRDIAPFRFDGGRLLLTLA